MLAFKFYLRLIQPHLNHLKGTTMRGTIAKMLRRAVRAEPAPLQMEYSKFNGMALSGPSPLTFRYPKTSAQAEYKALKRLYHATGH